MSDVAQVALWALVLVPACVGGVLALTRHADAFAVPASLAAASIAVACSVLVALEQPAIVVPFVSGADFGIRVDALSAVVTPMVTAVTLLVLVFSAAEIRAAQARFHGLMLVFAASASLTATASTLLTVLFAWEVMGATSYALIGFWWRDDDRVSAGMTAFITTRTADLGMYVAAAAAFAAGSGLAIDDLPNGTDGWRDVIAGGLLVASLGKAAQLPFSFWLSRAMAGPSPVSALLHSAAMVAMGGYLLLRVQPLLASTGWAAPVTAWLGAGTAVVLGAVALAQRDLKQLLAASTSAQLGFVVMAAGLASVSGGVAQLVAHAATKALLFLAAGAWLSALGTKRLAGLSGVARRWVVLGVAATVGGLALAGVPPLSLWATKDAILSAALQESRWLYAAGLVAAALSAAYAGKMLWIIWRSRDGYAREVATYRDEEQPGTGDVAGLAQAPVVVLAVGAAVLGLLALPPLAGSLARALGEADVPSATPLELLTSAVVALATVAAVARWRLPEPRWALGWLGLEEVAAAIVVRPTMRLAGALARFDDGVLDRGVDQLASTVGRIGGQAARADDHRIDGAVEWFAGRMRRFGEIARRPQTGQLYQYYVQAVAVIAVGVLFLVVVR